jgi:hypothetical protein
MAKRIEIKEGERFGKLTVIKEGQSLRQPSGQVNRTIICKCDCGNTTQVRLLHLIRGRTASCGCLIGEKHNDRKTRLYKKWCAMKNRCNSNYRLPRYERLKVTICDEWRDSYLTFKKWAESNNYKEGLQIDRIDNHKGYEPSNCRFITNEENCNNRDITMRVNYRGEIYAIRPLLKRLNLFEHEAAIRTRIKRGWDETEAIDTPIRTGNYRREEMDQR